IVFEMSSGWPNRLKTVRALKRAYIGFTDSAAAPASDMMMPGAMALDVMLWRPPSSPAVFDKVGPHLPGAVERAGEVHAHVAIPELVRLVRNLRGVVERGRVVDQDVDLSELVVDLLEHVANLVAVRHVHLDGQRLAAHLSDLFGGRVGVNPALRYRDLREG